MRRNNMSSTNKTSLGLNIWEASDKPVRQDFVNDNVIIDEKISELNSNLALKADKSSLGTKITLPDTGIFHINRQMVIEYPNYYAISITILPTATPTTDTPMLTFPSQLATCVLAITTGYAEGITYASNNNQMFYRLLTGTINNTTEIIINGIVPKA